MPWPSVLDLCSCRKLLGVCVGAFPAGVGRGAACRAAALWISCRRRLAGAPLTKSTNRRPDRWPTAPERAALHGYDVEVAFQNGVARLTGTVADQPQREEVLRIVQGVPGVERVLDRLSNGNVVRPVRADEPPLVPLPTPVPPPSSSDLPFPQQGPAVRNDGGPIGRPQAPRPADPRLSLCLFSRRRALAL